MSKVLFCRVDDIRSFAGAPQQQTPGAAGFDLSASLETGRSVAIQPLSRKVIGTNLAFSPEHPLFILSRSGNAAKHGLIVLNAPGLIDVDYRGEIGVVLYNTNPNQTLIIDDGDRIAQIISMPSAVTLEPILWEETTRELMDNTDRGTGGFGSTGV